MDVPKVATDKLPYDIGDLDTPAVCLNNYDETNVIKVEGFTNDENKNISKSSIKFFGINHIILILINNYILLLIIINRRERINYNHT
jgi:hypothetical protein